MNFERWVKIIGIIAGVVSLITLAVTLVQLHHDYQEAEIRDWQDTAVFSIVSHSPVTGMSEKDIQLEYNARARDRFKELPREDIQTPALERTLLRVISTHAIQQLSNGSFAFAAGPAVTPDIECRQISGDYVHGLVLQHPGSYNFDDIQQHLKNSHQPCELSDAEFSLLIGTMTGMGAITQRNDKFFPGLGPYSAPASAPMSFAPPTSKKSH